MDISWRIVTLGRKKEKVERVESSRVFTWGCTARRRRGRSDVTWFSSIVTARCQHGAYRIILPRPSSSSFSFFPFRFSSVSLNLVYTFLRIYTRRKEKTRNALSRERRRIELPNNRWADKRAGVRCVRRAISKSPRVRFNDANRNGNKDTHRYRHKAGWSVDAKFFSLSLSLLCCYLYLQFANSLWGLVSLSPLFLPESSSGDRT